MRTDDRQEPVRIGKVGSASGLRGEFRVILYTQDSENLKEGKNLLFRHAGSDTGNSGENEIEAVCRKVRYQKDKPVISIEGVNDRNDAEALRGMEIYIKAEELEALPEGEHYVRNLIGCRVVDIAGGMNREIGTLRDVIQNTAQSVLEIETEDGKSILVPAVDEFLRNIDEENMLIELELIPGFV